MAEALTIASSGLGAARTAADVFSDFAKQHVPQNFGKTVRYNKGTWFVAGEEVRECTLFVAQIPEVQILCTKWVNSKPAVRRTEYVRDRARFPERDMLGDVDPTKWERGNDGKPKDPWSVEMVLPLIRVEDDELCCYFTSSQGGKSAIAGLAAQYADRIRTGAFGLPIIDLKSGHYDHPQYGKTLKPILAIESWQDSGLPPPAPRIGATPTITAIAPAPAPAPGAGAPPAKHDDIPF
jgi:hypothetical protein